LDAIGREMAESHGRGSVDIVFAEYLLFSHYYVLRATVSGQELGIYATDQSNEKKLASSFDQFLKEYLANPSAIANCW
jgi:hypothetical protein